MDPFDEFEFKPLTDGLGFHKKSVSLKEGLKKTGVVDDRLNDLPSTLPRDLLDEGAKLPSAPKHTFEDVLSALEKTPIKKPALDLEFTDALPRSKDKVKAMDVEIPRSPSLPRAPELPKAPKVPQAPVQSPFPQPDAYDKTPVAALKKVPLVQEQAAVGTRRGAADSPMRHLELTPVSFASAFLDFIIVLAMSIIFLIALLMVTKVDLGVVLANLDRDTMTKIAFGVLFIAVMQMYAVVSRSFFGRTIGEWTFEVQLGEDKEQALESYPLRVALRSLITTATGLAVLPLASAILGFDVAGKLSGVKLYRQRV